MNHPKTTFNKMTSKTIFNNFFNRFDNTIDEDRYFEGIIYTLYSNKENLIEVGFAKSIREINKKLLKNKFILLDQKKGKESELYLLIETLNQLGHKALKNKYYHFSYTTIRHLHTFNWPIGKSLYKKRKIKKQLVYAVS